MEQNTRIFFPAVKNGQAVKTQSRTEQLSARAEGDSAKFGKIMSDAMQAKGTKQVKASSQNPVNNISELGSQITALSIKTERLLANAGPKDVDNILSQAVSQIWKLIGNFDTQHGTKYVSQLSKQLSKGTKNSGIEGELFLGVSMQLANLTTKQPAILGVTQKVVSEIATQISPVKSASLPSAQAVPLADNASLFAPVIQALSKLQPLSQKGQIPAGHKQPAVNVAVTASTELLPKGAAGWQELVQQVSVETPLKNKTPDNAITRQSIGELANTASKTAIAPIMFVGGGDVKAKLKDLLLVSAQTIVSGADATGLTDTGGSSLFQTKVDLQNVNATAQTQQAQPPRTFSQNIINQIQGKPLNEGITRIELAPRGLGKLVIELETKKIGDIKVILKAENMTVLNALRADRDTLLSALSNSNIKAENIDLDFDGFGQGQFNHNENGLTPGQNVPQPEAHNDNTTDMDNSVVDTPRVLSTGLLDILT